MTQDPHGAHADGPHNGSLNGRLDGWKEIAAYLNRGVRTAQRWEQELDMPVRRLDTGGAETVYAFKKELDAWLLRQSRSGTDKPAPAAPPPRRERFWLAAAGLVLIIGAIGASALLNSPQPAESSPAGSIREPAAIEVVGNTLSALDMEHEVIWSKPFEGPLDDFDPSTEGGRSNHRRLAAIGDFRGTGHNDVILARSSDRDRRLYWFDHAGSLVRTYRSDPRVTFGREHCTSIRFSRLFTHVDSADPRAIWIAGHELAGNFPAVLQALGPSGEVRSEYWSAGFIGAMAIVRVDGRRLIIVGSAANETGGAALAVFDRSAQGSSPAADAEYRCAGCPAGAPLHYLVFPRSRLQAELGENAQVVEVIAAPGGTIRIRVIQAGDSMLVGTAASAYYTLDPAFRIVDDELGSEMGSIQRKYEAEHLVSSATRPRGDADLYPVLRWNGIAYDRIDGPEVR